MANDFKSLWRKEVEKLNRQIHTYEKEGVRFVYKTIDEEETPTKKYTQADIDLVKAKRLKLFEGATMYDSETGRTYKGKEEITTRVRQRKQQAKQIKTYFDIQQDVEKEIKQNKKLPKKETDNIYIKESRPTKEIASLENSIAHQLIQMATTFNPIEAFPGRSLWFYQEKDKQAKSFLDIILECLNTKDFAAYINPFIQTVEDMKNLLYDSSEFSDTPRSLEFMHKLVEFAQQAEIMSEKEIEDFYKQYGIEQYESEDYVF